MKPVLAIGASLLLPAVCFAGGGDMDYQGILEDKQHVFYFDALLQNGTAVPDSSSSVIPIRIRPSKMTTSSSEAPLEEITGCFVVADKNVPVLLVCSQSSTKPEFRGVAYNFAGKAAASTGSKFTCIKGCGAKVPRLFKLTEWAATTE